MRWLLTAGCAIGLGILTGCANDQKVMAKADQFNGSIAPAEITNPDVNAYFTAIGRRVQAAAKIAEGKTVSGHVNAMIVPGSGLVKDQAEAEGLDKIFIKAGFEWREPGCSMCLAMNPDKLSPQERCASTSNRNFEGRQGFKGRTHLVSPAMAAAAAIAGHFVDVREWR